MRRTRKRQLPHLSYFTAFVLVTMLLCSVLPATEFPACGDEYLSPDNVRIERHDRRRTAQVIAKEESELQHLWGVYYGRRENRTGHILNYTELPLCRQSVLELKEVAAVERGSDMLDILYFQQNDKMQLEKARVYRGTAIAYSPALMEDQQTREIDVWQQLARFSGIDCLPTRFRFVRVGGKRYVEFRKGDVAWKE